MMRFSLPFKSWNGERREYSCLLEMEALGFLEYILECFVNIYRYLKILWVFPRGFCYESAIQSPHPWLKVIEPSWQISSHARVCPWGYPPLITAFGRNYVIITRIERKQKTLQIHFEFSYFFFVLIHLETFIRFPSSLKNHTQFQTKIRKVHTHF